MNTNQKHRPLYEYAQDIRSDYADQGKSVYYAAAPYVDAMRYLDQIDDMYGWERADTLVITLLGNLKTWRGPEARRVKAELREILAKR